MKKIMLLALVLFMIVPAVSASVEYFDNFNYSSSDVLGWTEIELAGRAEVDNNLLMIKNNSDNELYIKRGINSTDNPYVAFTMNVTGSSFDSSAIRFFNGSFRFLTMGVNNNSFQWFNGSGWHYVDATGNNTINLSQVYFIELDIDYASNTYDIYIDHRLRKVGAEFEYYDTPEFGPIGWSSQINNVSVEVSGSFLNRTLTIGYLRIGNDTLVADSRIDNVEVGTVSDLIGYCNASMPNSTVRNDLFMRWYNGSNNFISYNISDAISGVESTFNISSSLTSIGETWSFSCYARNSMFTSDWSANSSVTIGNYSLDNCSVFTNRSAQFTVYNEQYPTNSLNAYIEIEGTYWENPNTKYNFSMISNNSDSYGICISHDNITLYSDLYVKYTTSNGFTHRYYVYNQSLTNNTINISLYNYDTTTGISDVTITARDDYTYSYLSNIVGKMQRQYVGEGVWRTVQMDKSGDYGQLLFNIEEEDTDYRFIFMDTDNHVLATTSAMKFICSSGHCSVTYTLSEYGGAVSPNNLSTNYSYDNNTGIISIVWSDPTGRTAAFTTLVTQERGSSSLMICSNTSTGSSGTQSCDISAFTGTIVVRTYGTVDGVNQYTLNEIIEKAAGALFTVVNEGEGTFWTVGIVTTCFAFGLFSPAGAALSVILGLVFAKMLGLLSVLSTAMIIVVAALGVAIGLKVRR